MSVPHSLRPQVSTFVDFSSLLILLDSNMLDGTQEVSKYPSVWFAAYHLQLRAALEDDKICSGLTVASWPLDTGFLIHAGTAVLVRCCVRRTTHDVRHVKDIAWYGGRATSTRFVAHRPMLAALEVVILNVNVHTQ